MLEVEGKDEFSQLCQDFEEMRKRLKESTEEKILMDKENKELISNISHDLKTPITAIKGYVEGIMDGVADTPEKMEKYVRTIYNKTNEMDLLINELTIYSKIDTNRIPYNFSKINVAEYFEDCVEEIGMDLDSKGIGLSYINYAEDDIVVIEFCLIVSIKILTDSFELLTTIISGDYQYVFTINTACQILYCVN